MSRFSFKLPDVGEGIAEAEIVAWHVKVGDVIAEDQPLVDVMTEKANVEITSPVAGRVLSVEGELGTVAAIGSVIAVLEVDGAGDAEPPPAKAEAASPRPAPSVATPSAPADGPASDARPRGRQGDGLPSGPRAGGGDGNPPGARAGERTRRARDPGGPRRLRRRNPGAAA